MGALHILVNNAAPLEVSGPTGQLFEEAQLKNWEEMLRKVLEGVTLTIQCVIRHEDGKCRAFPVKNERR